MCLLQIEEDNRKHSKVCPVSGHTSVVKNSLWILSNLCCGTTELFQHKYQFGIKKVFVVQSRPLKTLVYQLSQKIKVLV